MTGRQKGPLEGSREHAGRGQRCASVEGGREGRRSQKHLIYEYDIELQKHIILYVFLTNKRKCRRS